MASGTVKWFNNRVGYGFVEPDESGKDIFVHITAVKESGFKTLRENQRIKFDIGDHNGKRTAINITLINDGKSSINDNSYQEYDDEEDQIATG